MFSYLAIRALQTCPCIIIFKSVLKMPSFRAWHYLSLWWSIYGPYLPSMKSIRRSLMARMKTGANHKSPEDRGLTLAKNKQRESWQISLGLFYLLRVFLDCKINFAGKLNWLQKVCTFRLNSSHLHCLWHRGKCAQQFLMASFSRDASGRCGAALYVLW